MNSKTKERRAERTIERKKGPRKFTTPSGWLQSHSMEMCEWFGSLFVPWTATNRTAFHCIGGKRLSDFSLVSFIFSLADSICILSFCNFVWYVLSLFSRRLNSSDVLHDNILNIVYRITMLCELKPSRRRETTYCSSHNILVHTIHKHTHTYVRPVGCLSRSLLFLLHLKFESISRVRRSVFKIYVSDSYRELFPLFALGYGVDFSGKAIASIAACYLSNRTGCSDCWLKRRATMTVLKQQNNGRRI